MIPDTYHDRDDESDEPDPADWPPYKPGRPYGVYPAPPGSVREPWMTAEDLVKMPGHMPGQSTAEWLANRAAYIEDLRQKRGIAAAGAKPDGSSPAGSSRPVTGNATPPAAGKPPQPEPAQPAELAAPAAPSASAAVAESAAPKPAKSRAQPWLRRHERFCQLFVVYGNAADAATKAGYSVAASANQGYRLLKRPEIQARIAELHRGLAADFSLDAEVLLGKLETVYRQAIEAKSLSAAARVVELQARLAGHVRGRAHHPADATATANDDK